MCELPSRKMSGMKGSLYLTWGSLLFFDSYFTCKTVTNWFYYLACVCSRCNTSDWPILGHYSPVMPTSQLQASKPKAKSHIISNSLTSNVWSLLENLNHIDLAIPRAIRQSLALRFSRKDLTLGLQEANLDPIYSFQGKRGKMLCGSYWFRVCIHTFPSKE